MINIKKIIFFLIKSALTLVIFLTLVLFFYATFFFEPPVVEKKTAENQITKSEEPSTPTIEEAELEKTIEEIESKKEITKIEVPESKEIIEDSLFATIGNKAITHSDIINEIKIILILTGQSFTENIKDQLQAGAIQSTIKRTIKKIEIEKHDFLIFNREDLNLELERFSSNLNMDVETFKNTFIANGIDFSHITDQIRTELLWNTLIFEIYKDRLIVNADEIEDQLKSIQGKKEIEEYLISEIVIQPVSKDKLKSRIEEIKNKIKTEGFEKVAMNLSISETALKGGDLGWVSENAISKAFKSKIINTFVGNISEPIILSEGILLFKVRDKRKIKETTSLEEQKNRLVKNEKSKILRMHSMSHFENLRKSISINYYK